MTVTTDAPADNAPAELPEKTAHEVTGDVDAASNAAPEAPADPWADLLAVAEMVDSGAQEKRSKVAVPDAVKGMAQKAWDAKQRIMLPFKADTYDEIANVFYSAGDLLTPPATVTVAKVKKDANGKVVVVKGSDTPTHVRVSINERRGQKVKKTDAEKAPAKTD